MKVFRVQRLTGCDMEVQITFLQVFGEINTYNARLVVLGREGKVVIGKMLNSGGVTLDDVSPLLNLARKVERAELVEEEVTQKGKEQRRYNGGIGDNADNKIDVPTVTQLETVWTTCRESAPGGVFNILSCCSY